MEHVEHRTCRAERPWQRSARSDWEERDDLATFMEFLTFARQDRKRADSHAASLFHILKHTATSETA